VKPGRSVPSGFFIALLGVLAMAGLLALLAFTKPAGAADVPIQPAPGLTCTHLTARYTLKDLHRTAERVRVLDIASLPSGTAGAWVMPVSGPFSWGHFHVAAADLFECEADK